MRAAAIALLLAGCTGADASNGWNGVVDTLPSGAVRVSNPSQGLWRDGSGWRLIPELQIGEVDGPEPFTFAAISGLAVDDEGRVYVLDRQANELRIFSAAGEHVRTVGRSGGGPGEFATANGLLWLTPDTLVVVDQRGARYSILTREGAFIRSTSRQLTFYAWAFSGGQFDGRIYERASVGNGPDRRTAFVGTSLRSSPDAPGDRDTLFLPVPEAPRLEGFSVRTDRGGMTMSVPFAPGAVYHLDATGTIWHGHGSAFRLARTTLTGDTIIEILVDIEATPVTSAELTEWEQGEFVQRFRDMGGKLDMDRIPKVKPFFDDLYQSPEGYLWVSVPAGPREVVFAVLDDGGRYLGQLKATGFRRDVFVPPVVRGGRLHVAGRDDMDVPKIYVFRIERLSD